MKHKIDYKQTFLGDVNDAMAYGVEEAIVLNHIRNWVKYNKGNRQNQHEGRYWTYNSRQAMMEWFPYWNDQKIRRLLVSLKDQGAILISSFNVNPFDNTSWYTTNDASSLAPISKRDVEEVE